MPEMRVAETEWESEPAWLASLRDCVVHRIAPGRASLIPPGTERVSVGVRGSRRRRRSGCGS